ncbi:MAG: HPP family protein [Magnetococcales bacterium]|nr:HPP family protein [Magnetococcales bacterium]MBF0438591.1 HPP family protein [Magnetococcales bacterium]
MTFFAHYRAKMRGGGTCPPCASTVEIFWSWLGSFLGILLVAGLEQLFFTGTDLFLMIGSFGASAVLLYAAPTSPLAQPRNLLGGHLVSAFIGVVFFQMVPQQAWLASSLAVSLSIVGMHLTRTLHPPGGATALIAVIGSKQVHDLGFLYLLIPVFVGACLLLVVALFVNNLAPGRRYPLWWF